MNISSNKVYGATYTASPLLSLSNHNNAIDHCDNKGWNVKCHEQPGRHIKTVNTTKYSNTMFPTNDYSLRIMMKVRESDNYRSFFPFCMSATRIRPTSQSGSTGKRKLLMNLSIGEESNWSTRHCVLASSLHPTTCRHLLTATAECYTLAFTTVMDNSNKTSKDLPKYGYVHTGSEPQSS